MHKQAREKEKIEVNRTCDLYFQYKLSLPRKFFPKPLTVINPRDKCETCRSRRKPGVKFTDSIQR